MPRHWSNKEKDIAVSMSERFNSLQAIAAKVGRSETAVRHILSRLPFAAPVTKSSGGKCQRDVARMFGVDDGAVSRWVRYGYLKARYVSSHHLRISEESIREFMEREDTWHHWNPLTLSDQNLRQWAIHERRSLTFLSSIGVARRLHVPAGRVRRLIARGELKAVRTSPQAVWQIRTDWFEQYRKNASGKKTNGQQRILSEQEKAYLRQWRPTQSYLDLAQHFGYGAAFIRKQCLEMGLVNISTRRGVVGKQNHT